MEFCKFTAHFVALSVIENALLPNSFEVGVTFSVNTPNTHEQNVAFQRIKHLVNEELNCTIIVHKTSPIFKTLNKFQNKIVVLPDDGPDWMLSCALLFKLNAIAEGRFTINQVEVSSSLGDHISYYAIWEEKDLVAESLSDLQTADRWWNNSDICFNRFQKFNTWKAIGLDWQLQKTAQDVNIEKVIQFKPKIVKGGNSNN